MTEFLPSRPSLAHSTLLLLILHSSDNDDETADFYWGAQKVFAKTNSAVVLIKPEGKHQIGWNTMILPNLMRMGDTVGR